MSLQIYFIYKKYLICYFFIDGYYTKFIKLSLKYLFCFNIKLLKELYFFGFISSYYLKFLLLLFSINLLKFLLFNLYLLPNFLILNIELNFGF